MDRRALQATDRKTRLLKQGIWLYFFLLIFEGALRKWFLPGLATPLLIIRDPLALWLIVIAWTHHRISYNAHLLSMTFIGVLSIFTAVTLGHGNFFVALFGARILLIQFPFIFVIGQIFTRDDVIKVGTTTLWITIPMTILVILQFYSPQSAWVNRSIGGDTTGAGFSGALGYFRPPATFSFTNGTTLFYSFVACFVFYFWLNPDKVNRLALIGATLGLLAAVPLSISRALFLQVGVTILFTIIAAARKPKFIVRMIIAGIGLLLAMALLNKASFFQTATEAFTARFDSANEQAGGFQSAIVDRFLGGLLTAIESSSDVPFFGYGLGMGTNVGAQLLTGNRLFLISEEEWGRLVGELGVLFGLLVIFVRLSLSSRISLASYKQLQMGNLLPWMLLSFGLLSLLQGGWAQPTSLGFSVFIGGLMIASIRKTS
ncbi:MAG: hypothetical protein BGO59_19080 [Spirosoma sp. 48-14]|nr:MAG: hypothetical protein BGO59_19080 [Spirosoma sp. 48-14]